LSEVWLLNFLRWFHMISLYLRFSDCISLGLCSARSQLVALYKLQGKSLAEGSKLHVFPRWTPKKNNQITRITNPITNSITNQVIWLLAIDITNPTVLRIFLLLNLNRINAGSESHFGTFQCLSFPLWNLLCHSGLSKSRF
jgi:hypothetical protein